MSPAGRGVGPFSQTRCWDLIPNHVAVENACRFEGEVFRSEHLSHTQLIVQFERARGEVDEAIADSGMSPLSDMSIGSAGEGHLLLDLFPEFTSAILQSFIHRNCYNSALNGDPSPVPSFARSDLSPNKRARVNGYHLRGEVFMSERLFLHSAPWLKSSKVLRLGRPSLIECDSWRQTSTIPDLGSITRC